MEPASRSPIESGTGQKPGPWKTASWLVVPTILLLLFTDHWVVASILWVAIVLLTVQYGLVRVRGRPFARAAPTPQRPMTLFGQLMWSFFVLLPVWLGDMVITTAWNVTARIAESPHRGRRLKRAWNDRDDYGGGIRGMGRAAARQRGAYGSRNRSRRPSVIFPDGTPAPQPQPVTAPATSTAVLDDEDTWEPPPEPPPAEDTDDGWDLRGASMSRDSLRRSTTVPTRPVTGGRWRAIWRRISGDPS